ncbi:MAG: TRAP transporter large permease [Actinobacteria bacterium]|nr:TRAP transporter large permease [Actinomycetota bacterium]
MGLAVFIIVFLILLLTSAPVAVAMIGSSIFFLLFVKPDDLVIVSHRMVLTLDAFPLVAIPLFVLVGELMSRGGLTERLVAFASLLVGRLTGGLAHVTVVSNMLMSGITGSAAADAAATGSLLIPAMRSRGYSAPFAAAITAASATMGPVIPPSIPMVVLGVMAGISIGKLFIGGIMPGILMGAFLMIAAYLVARRRGYGAGDASFARDNALAAVRGAIFPLVVPILIIGGILGGVFTPTEAADAGVLVVLLIGSLAFRELGFRDILQSLRQTIRIIGPIMLIVSAASVFGLVLTQERGGELLTGFVTSISRDPTVVLALISVTVLILGMFMEGLAIVILLIPVLTPLIVAVSIDPVHFGVVFIMSLSIGLITPPVGITMYIGMSIAKISMEEFTREIWPYLAALLLVLALIVVFPPAVLVLPSLLMPTP